MSDSTTPSHPAHQASLTAGSWPVMLTPFTAAKQIDWPAFDALVDWYIASRLSGAFRGVSIG